MRAEAPLPRFPSTPEIVVELDSELLEDEDDCNRTLELRANPYPSVAPTALDLPPPRPYHPSRLSLTAKQRLHGARTIVIAAVGACAALFVGAVVVGMRASSSPPEIARTDEPIVRVAAVQAPVPMPDPKPVRTAPKDPPPVKAMAPAPKPRPRAQATGTIRTFRSASTKTVVVDGRRAGTAGTPITVSCGQHRVQIGSDAVRTVDVPCYGAVTVGTPG